MKEVSETSVAEKQHNMFSTHQVTQRQLCHNDRVKRGLTDEYKN